MAKFVIKRFLIMLAMLAVLSFVVFVIIELPPGDFADRAVYRLKASGVTVTEQEIIGIRHQLGLDRPFLERYLIWVSNIVLRGDWGVSMLRRLPVTVVIGDRLGFTAALALATLFFTYGLAIPIGILSAVRQYSAADYSFTFLGYIGMATPNFLLALVLMYFANVQFGLSIGGMMDPQYLDAPMSWAKFLSVLSHLWIPVIVIGTSGTAGMIRRLRANLLDELQKQYVVTARSKGMPQTRLLVKYPLRMALNPFVADIGNLLPSVISGSAIVSVVLSLQTEGPMLLDALQSQDQYLAGSFLMFLSMLTVLGVFVSDLLLAALDPRIRLSGEARK